MATEIKWSIALVEYTNDADKGVVLAHWRADAQDGDYVADAYGVVTFTPNPTAEGFIPYADLTEADVLAWVWGSVEKNEIEAKLAAQIADQKAPAKQSGLPWA